VDNYLKGKRIALVGPAKSIEGSNNGAYIDSHDVVVRLNHAKIGNPIDSGSKTNVIYYDGSHHDYEGLNLDYLICSYPPTEWFFTERCLRVAQVYGYTYPGKHKIIDDNLYSNLKTKLNENNRSRPNTGLIAMVDLLRHDIESLFITGLDFYRTSYAKEHPDYGDTDLDRVSEIFKIGDNGDYHDIEGKFHYFLNNVATDQRLEVDDFLSEYLS
jgi:hypothetical protein